MRGSGSGRGSISSAASRVNTSPDSHSGPATTSGTRVASPLPGGGMHADVVVGAVHRRAHQIDEAGVDHDERVARALLVCARRLDVGDARDQRGAGRDDIAAGLDLDAQGPPGTLAQPPLRPCEDAAEGDEVDRRPLRPVRMRDAAAHIDRLQVGKVGNALEEEMLELAHVGVELVDGRAAADVRMQQHDRIASPRSGMAYGVEVLVPDPVLRARPAGIARPHVAVAETGVDAQPDRAAVAGLLQSGDHGRRADIGQDAVLQDDVQGVVAEDVGGQQNGGWGVADREAGGGGAQRLVARHGIDPQAGSARDLEQAPRRAGLHRIARLHGAARRDGAHVGNSAAQDVGAVDVEGGTDAPGDGGEIDVVEEGLRHAWTPAG